MGKWHLWLTSLLWETWCVVAGQVPFSVIPKILTNWSFKKSLYELDTCTIMPSSGQDNRTAPGESDSRKAPIYPTASRKKHWKIEVHLEPILYDVIFWGKKNIKLQAGIIYWNFL